MEAPSVGAPYVASQPTATAIGSTGEGTSRVTAASSSQQRADRVAGFLCAFSLALSGIALVRNPGVLAPAAIVVALIAVRMTEAHRTLAAVAVAVSSLAFFFGMVIAITTDNGLY